MIDTTIESLITKIEWIMNYSQYQYGVSFVNHEREELEFILKDFVCNLNTKHLTTQWDDVVEWYENLEFTTKGRGGRIITFRFKDVYGRADIMDKENQSFAYIMDWDSPLCIDCEHQWHNLTAKWTKCLWDD